MRKSDYYRNDALNYEDLLRKVFNCGRSGDPFTLADTDMYNYTKKKEVELESRLGIWIALRLIKNKLTPKNQNYQILSQLEEEILKYKSRKRCREIVNAALKILDTVEKRDFFIN